MFEARIHGRGGQGVVTAAELLSVAAFDQGRHAQAVPSFGSERMGAPVVSYCRIDERPIRSHDPVSHPCCVVVQDPTLLRLPAVTAGLRLDGHLIVNSSRSAEDLGLPALVPGGRTDRMLTVPASDLARLHLGRPMPNTALLGAVAASTGIVALDSLCRAIRERFAAELSLPNEQLARAAYRLVADRAGSPDEMPHEMPDEMTPGGRRAHAG